MSQKNHRERTLRQRILGTGKSGKNMCIQLANVNINSQYQDILDPILWFVHTIAAKKMKAETTGADCIASRTRQRKGTLTKAQISGPLELQDSPSLVRMYCSSLPILFD